jgi:hypothetical protein
MALLGANGLAPVGELFSPPSRAGRSPRWYGER